MIRESRSVKLSLLYSPSSLSSSCSFLPFLPEARYHNLKRCGHEWQSEALELTPEVGAQESMTCENATRSAVKIAAKKEKKRKAGPDTRRGSHVCERASLNTIDDLISLHHDHREVVFRE
jgi:hypothetical protein